MPLDESEERSPRDPDSKEEEFIVEYEDNHGADATPSPLFIPPPDLVPKDDEADSGGKMKYDLLGTNLGQF